MTSEGSSKKAKNTLTLSANIKLSKRGHARYLRLWEAIRKTRDELKSWQTRVDRIMTNFNVQIRPRENNLTRTVQSITDELITHAESSTLDQSHSALLHLWVIDNLESLEHHPFADPETTTQLQKRWYAYVYSDQSGQTTGANTRPEDPLGFCLDEELDDDDIVFNFSSSYEKPNHRRHGDNKKSNSRDEQNPFENGGADDHPNERTSEEFSEKFSSVGEKVLGDIVTVDQLFRPLARALHPDREQDETRQAEKHALMSECLQARENNDIDTLLSLYIEHIGDLPKGLVANSHDELIKLLERQLRAEQLKLQKARFNNGFERMLLERYQREDESSERIAFVRHATSLDEEIHKLSVQNDLIKTESGLLQALDDRKLVEQDRVSISRLTGA